MAAPADPLPEAPSATVVMVNGQPYRQPTAKQKFIAYGRSTVGPQEFALTGVRAAFQFARDKPSGWGQDFPGYMQRYGSSFAEHSINSTTRYLLASALHEDIRYILCHKCTRSEKIRNAFLSEFTARHGADGHRAFSATVIASSVPGALIANRVWYPANSNRGSSGVRIVSGVGARIGLHIVRELFFDRDKKPKKSKTDSTSVEKTEPAAK